MHRSVARPDGGDASSRVMPHAAEFASGAKTPRLRRLTSLGFSSRNRDKKTPACGRKPAGQTKVRFRHPLHKAELSRSDRHRRRKLPSRQRRSKRSALTGAAKPVIYWPSERRPTRLRQGFKALRRRLRFGSERRPIHPFRDELGGEGDKLARCSRRSMREIIPMVGYFC